MIFCILPDDCIPWMIVVLLNANGGFNHICCDSSIALWYRAWLLGVLTVKPHIFIDSFTFATRNMRYYEVIKEVI